MDDNLCYKKEYIRLNIRVIAIKENYKKLSSFVQKCCEYDKEGRETKLLRD